MIHSPPQLPYVLDGLAYGLDDAVAAWVLGQIKEMTGTSFGSCAAIGILRDSRIVGGVVFNNFHGHSDGGDISVSIALAPEARITKGMWRRLFDYPFGQIGCRRLTTYAIRTNKAARRFNERLGFRLEGVRREGHGAIDVFMFGMLRTECKFWSPN